MGRPRTDTPANRELSREVDAVRSMAADWQRQEARGVVPAGTADSFRRDMAVALNAARLRAIRKSESELARA